MLTKVAKVQILNSGVSNTKRRDEQLNGSSSYSLQPTSTASLSNKPNSSVSAQPARSISAQQEANIDQAPLI